MTHRAEAQKVAGITDAQQAGLRLGRPKGTNRRVGYRHSEETKRQIAATNEAFWSAHPELAALRGLANRGQRNANWSGGINRLNTSIRQMHENRVWMDAVKGRDGACVRCGDAEDLESHHKVGLAELVAALGIASRDDARRHAAILWDLSNGETLCQDCHYAEHGRARRAHIG
jgi:hypothetical protein